MITFRRISSIFRVAKLDDVDYGLMELPGYDGAPAVVSFAARVDSEQFHLGEWEQVGANADEARARELIAEHHEALLGRPKSAAA